VLALREVSVCNAHARSFIFLPFGAVWCGFLRFSDRIASVVCDDLVE
jgi:hypothetical protein